jgi:signal transduction histidine kinase
MIREAIQQDISAIDFQSAGPGVFSTVSRFGAYYQKRGISLAMYTNGFALYSSLPMEPDNIETESGRSCRIITNAGIKYLFINDTLSGPSETYPFIYLRDISHLYQSLQRQITFLIIVGASVTVVFAFGLYLTLKSVYRPVGNLAHELRTPLTSIRGYAEYLQAAAATEEERYSAATYIIDESKRLSDVCDKLLILANLREGEIPFEKVDIAALFENAKMTYKNVEYEAETQYLRGNKTLLQSMINNLVSNALKASAPGEPVTIRAYDKTIEITDRGSGMSEELLTRISRPNYNPGISAGNKSSGLGIPLCHSIARLHGAQLTFVSRPGEGTTATISFTNP